MSSLSDPRGCITVEWMICIEDPNSDAPVFDGLKWMPVWSLFASDEPGPYYWGMSKHGEDLTYRQALARAHILGFQGSPIGG